MTEGRKTRAIAMQYDCVKRSEVIIGHLLRKLSSLFTVSKAWRCNMYV